MSRINKTGFTLMEVNVSMFLLVMALGLALSGYMFALKNAHQSDIQNELDIDVQLAMEILKRDLRLSSLDEIYYHPAGSGPYTAISFPRAYDDDGDGILEKDGDGKILWDETVVYHIRPTTPNQLVKTTFRPRNNTLTDAQRQTQLEDVVADGDGTSTYNSGNASSKAIFANLLNWKILPKKGLFDAYAPTITRDKASLGYILLDSGPHDITFEVVGKNSSASAYHIGIDQILASPSTCAYEAEDLLPASNITGTTPFKWYMSAGSWKGNHQLFFLASAVGHEFTISTTNDCWRETNFGGLGYLAEDTCIEFDTTLSPKDYIVRLDGMDTTWETPAQTGDPEGFDPTAPLTNLAVRVLQRGSKIADNGSWFSYNGTQCRLSFSASSNTPLKVGNIYIGESSSISNASMDYLNTTAAPIVPVTFSGATAIEVSAGQTVASDWISLPIDREKNYLVSYRIANDILKAAPKIWTDYNAVTASNTTASALWVPDAAGHVENDASWSNRTDITVIPTNQIPGLAQTAVNHPGSGTYTSRIFDTHLSAPSYENITWNADVPTGTTLDFKVRSGNTPDLSDASDWSSIAAFSTPRTISASAKRYIQFQALLQSDTTGQLTPKLKDVTIYWAGERQLVEIGGIFTKGPNYGIFQISVDGQPLRSGLIIDLEIYKDVTAFKSKTRRITSELKVELTPRNSGL